MKRWALVGWVWLGVGCRPSDFREHDRGVLVLKRQPFGEDEAWFRTLLDRFEALHPGVRVVEQLIPNRTDVAHQYYLTALEGRSADFDVMVVDVVWIPEFARAGWVADLTDAFPRSRLEEAFLPGAVEAATWNGRTWALPWFVDVGLLYYRTDLVPRAPKSHAELVRFAQEARRRNPSLAGYVWQGRQYEGLNCNVFEALWGFGGQALVDGRFTLKTPEAEAALSYLRELVRSGVTPPSVTTAAEEESRRLFTAGRAVFMRNWPYAWAEGEKEGSAIRGRFDVTTLPGVDGNPAPGVLGGWNLAVNARISPERLPSATALIGFLSSEEGGLALAVHDGRNPPRPALYDSPELAAKAPWMRRLLPHLLAARPRPVTPWYMLATDTLQGEFSAAVAGLREPGASLQRAQAQLDHLMGVPR